MKKTILKIVGMHCTSCALTIDLDLEDLPGVKNAKTSYVKQYTEVEYDPQKVSEEQLLETISAAGYTAVVGS